MKLELCTLFDSNYLDKGLVLYESLQECCKNFNLYILPMDQKCLDILSELNLENLIVLDYEDFEDDDLKAIKNIRSRAEFCWSCTAKLVKYILNKYNVEMCTYVDSDLYFYQDPTILIQEMLDSNDSVQIVRHNFRKCDAKLGEKESGKYCVEFNTFLNNDNAKKVLDEWERDCLNDCSYMVHEGVLGDQMYLNKWPNEFSFINICKNQGAGVAPWNCNKFKYDLSSNYNVVDIESSKKYPLVFYHFQNVTFIDDKTIHCCSVNPNNKDELQTLYTDYLNKIFKTKQFLKNKFNLYSMIKIHPAKQDEDLDSYSDNLLLNTITRLRNGKTSFGQIFQTMIALIYHRGEQDLVVYLD